MVTKCHRLGGLNNRNLFSPISGGTRSLNIPENSISGQPFLPGWLCPHMAFALCLYEEGWGGVEGIDLDTFSLYNTTRPGFVYLTCVFLCIKKYGGSVVKHAWVQFAVPKKEGKKKKKICLWSYVSFCTNLTITSLISWRYFQGAGHCISYPLSWLDLPCPLGYWVNFIHRKFVGLCYLISKIRTIAGWDFKKKKKNVGFLFCLNWHWTPGLIHARQALLPLSYVPRT